MSVVESGRVSELNEKAKADEGQYVLYWMQSSQRAWRNPALDYAVEQSHDLQKPVVVAFALFSDYPDANARHFAFMLQGLVETAAGVEERGCRFLLKRGSPDEVAISLSKNAAIVVCDRGYLRHQKSWRQQLATKSPCRVVQVEGDVVVPVDEASTKAEYAARTIRPKIKKLLSDYLVDHEDPTAECTSNITSLPSNDFDPSDPSGTLEKLDLDRTVQPVRRIKGGTEEARRRLTSFLRRHLDGYEDDASEPAEQRSSMLSPYLHFGQISPVEVALKAKRAKAGSGADQESFLEELIVRRELAINFVHNFDEYDTFSCLPDWASKTLSEHEDDEREHVYTRKQLESSDTHDPYWNAAMTEMRATGFMHNTMRMYWGKKILEWTNTPVYGYRTTLHLNNKYFLDGRDPSSYANVAWCYGLHDQAWKERKIFGKVRYMNSRGLDRKFDMDAYCRRVEQLCSAEDDSES